MRVALWLTSKQWNENGSDTYNSWFIALNRKNMSPSSSLSPCAGWNPGMLVEDGAHTQHEIEDV